MLLLKAERVKWVQQLKETADETAAEETEEAAE